MSFFDRSLTIQLALLVMCALVLGGCGKPRGSGNPAAGAAGTAMDPTSPDASLLRPPQSIDDPSLAGRALPLLGRCPSFLLVDSRGNHCGNEHLAGRASVVMFLTGSTDAGLVEETGPVKSLQIGIRQMGLATSLRLVSIVVRPESVATDALAAVAQTIGADGNEWRVLGGAAEVTSGLFERDFPQALAIQHDSTLTDKLVLVDPQGDLRGTYSASDPDSVSALVDALRITIAERVVVLNNSIARGDQAESVLAPAWLDERSAAQHRTLEGAKVFHDFTFEDRRRESGITFRHRVVDDAGRSLVSAHYDHGNGVATADVDLDGLPDLFLVNQVGRSELWRNLGGGKFEDITDSAGAVMPQDRVGVSASFADIDNDGDPDLYVTVVRRGNVLFENLGKGTFKDITQAAGLGYEGHSSSAEFFDYDRDGLLDLFLVNVGKYTTDTVKPVTNDRYSGPDQGNYTYHTSSPDAFAAHLKPQRAEASVLYRNLGGNRFQDVSEAMGLVDLNWTGDASPIDGNQDGWPDLYLVNMQGHDVYYENVEGKRFENKSRRVFPATSWGTMGIKVFDYDNDGGLDLFLTDMHADMAKELGPLEEKQKIPSSAFDLTLLNTDGKHVWGNALFRRVGPDQFEEVSESLGTETYWPWGISVGDLNADGYDDVFVSASMNFPYRYGINSVLLNNRGQGFLDSEFVLGVEPRWARRTAVPWFELDFTGPDGRHPVHGALQNLQRNVSRAVVWGAIGSRSSLICDIDNDGDLDVVTNDFNSEPMVLVNNLEERKPDLKYLKIRLTGTASNRDGLGSVVRVKTSDSTFVKVYDGQSGYLSQSTYPLFFGLGDRQSVEQVEVVWPTGKAQTIAGPLPTNSVLEVREE